MYLLISEKERQEEKLGISEIVTYRGRGNSIQIMWTG